MTSIFLVLISTTFCLSAVLSCSDESLEQRSVRMAIIKTQQEKDLSVLMMMVSESSSWLTGEEPDGLLLLELIHLKIEALQAVLEKLKNKQQPNITKKFGQLPSCDVGGQCAARKGARVGKLCGCPPGSTCDFFIMKCL